MRGRGSAHSRQGCRPIVSAAAGCPGARPLDIAFVNYRQIEAAVVAAQMMHQYQLGGRPITARLARPRVPASVAIPSYNPVPGNASLVPSMAGPYLLQHHHPGTVYGGGSNGLSGVFALYGPAAPRTAGPGAASMGPGAAPAAYAPLAAPSLLMHPSSSASLHASAAPFVPRTNYTAGTLSSPGGSALAKGTTPVANRPGPASATSEVSAIIINKRGSARCCVPEWDLVPWCFPRAPVAHGRPGWVKLWDGSRRRRPWPCGRGFCQWSRSTTLPTHRDSSAWCAV